jgi:hypothetical protein
VEVVVEEARQIIVVALEFLVKEIMEALDITVEEQLEEAAAVEQVKLALVQLQWVVVLVVEVVMEEVVVEQVTV